MPARRVLPKRSEGGLQEGVALRPGDSPGVVDHEVGVGRVVDGVEGFPDRAVEPCRLDAENSAVPFGDEGMLDSSAATPLTLLLDRMC